MILNQSWRNEIRKDSDVIASLCQPLTIPLWLDFFSSWFDANEIASLEEASSFFFSFHATDTVARSVRRSIVFDRRGSFYRTCSFRASKRFSFMLRWLLHNGQRYFTAELRCVGFLEFYLRRACAMIVRFDTDCRWCTAIRDSFSTISCVKFFVL